MNSIAKLTIKSALFMLILSGISTRAETSSDNFVLDAYVLNSGGGVMTSSSFISVVDVTAQPVSITNMGSNNFHSYLGYLNAIHPWDTDLDGVRNGLDLDDDQDGLPDVFEVSYGMNPLDASDASFDMDNDSLSNFQEYGLGTLVSSSDTDGDGLSDGEEVLLGLNPLDPLDGQEVTSRSAAISVIVDYILDE